MILLKKTFATILLPLLLLGSVRSVDIAMLNACLADGETIQLACDNRDSTATPELDFERIQKDGYFVRARLACSGPVDISAVACFLEDGDGGYGVGVASQNEDATVSPMCFNSFNFNGEVRKYVSICLGAEVDEGDGRRALEPVGDVDASTGLRRAKKKSTKSSSTGKGGGGDGDDDDDDDDDGPDGLICNEPPTPSLWEIRQVLEFVEDDE